MTNFSHNLEVNIGNIFGELTPVKFRNLILTKLIKVIDRNEIKDHLKNETPKLDQSVTNSNKKRINILKEELNKKQTVPSQKFTSDSDKYCHISNVRPANMNTSARNDTCMINAQILFPKKQE